MKRVRLAVVAVALSFTMAPAFAQNLPRYYKAEKVQIQLVGGCQKPSDFEVVLRGDENARFPVTRNEHGYWTGPAPIRFEIDKAYASARVAGGRTLCHGARRISDPADADSWVAEFVIFCDARPAKVVSVETEPASAVAYVRFIPRSEVVKGSRECREFGAFEGPETIPEVRFDREKVRLQLLKTSATLDAPGLLLNANSVSLGLDGLAKAFREQSATAKGLALPHFSDDDALKEKLRLKKGGLRKLDVKVR